MMDDRQKRLEQLALAKDAGSKEMAKSFFAPTPGGEEDNGADGVPEPAGDEGGAPSDGAGGDLGGLSADKLQELIQLLQALEQKEGGQ